MAAGHLVEQIGALNLQPSDIKRWWLHQANLNMNQLISRRLLGHDPSQEEAPIVLDTFANTASAGSIIAFCLYHEDLVPGDYGVICSFGAGSSIGSLLVQKR
jgi:beta-ketodecanoyl-[acyl-carrier-protein] synthase